MSRFALTADEIIRSSLASLRRRSDLELTDSALEELERANLAVTTMTHTGRIKLLAPYPTPSQWVRQLIMRLQETYDAGRPSQRVRVRCLRNTLAAHDELMRLQGHLLSGGFDVWHRWHSAVARKKAS